jgi:DNA-binding Lrp family transcriptional regulator
VTEVSIVRNKHRIGPSDVRLLLALAAHPRATVLALAAQTGLSRNTVQSRLSGQTDLLVHAVAADADDLYRIAGQILAIPGVERTDTALVMRELVSYRITPLLHQRARQRRE